MHQKYNKLKYHKLYHSIPISCALALLLLGIICANPWQEGVNEAMAATSNPTNILLDPKISMSIYSPTDSSMMNSSIEAKSGVTSYISNIVNVSMQDIASYSLQLTAAQGKTSELVNGTTKINGASGQTGANLANDTWGYGWNTTGTADANMAYYKLPAYGATTSNNTNGLLESSSNVTSGTGGFTKKLTFAAKFSDSAPAGHYTTTALLSLAVSPKQVTVIPFNGITKMQEMTSAVCTGASLGDTGTLLDTRDGKTYTVAKIQNSKGEDAECWMTQNLALEDGTTLTINDTDLSTSVFTDVGKTYTLPAATTSGFSSLQVIDKSGTPTFANQQVRNAASPDTNKYGAYYSWCTATAGTCLQGVYADIIPNSNNTGNAGNVNKTTTLTSGNASSSICPKGWQLPVNGNTTTDKSYSKLLSGLSGSVGSTTMRGAPYNFVYGGRVNNSSLISAGSYGYYWSSTAYSAASAYYLSFGSSNVELSSNEGYNRSLGYSVRCVAR